MSISSQKIYIVGTWKEVDPNQYHNQVLNESIVVRTAKAEKDEQAAREFEKFKMMQDHETELAQIECDKMKAKFQAQAAAKAAEAKGSKGFWGKLGDRIIGVTDRAIKGLDVMDEVINEKFGMQDYVKKVEDNNIDY